MFSNKCQMLDPEICIQSAKFCDFIIHADSSTTYPPPPPSHIFLFNIEKLLLYFTKLCKCTHKYNFLEKNVRGGESPPERPTIGYAGAEDI